MKKAMHKMPGGHIMKGAKHMGKKLTSEKAKKILKDKTVRGHAITKKQKRFFGAVAGGQKPYGKKKKA